MPAHALDDIRYRVSTRGQLALSRSHANRADKPVSLWPPTEMLRFQGMWRWTRKKTIPEGFPEGFEVQHIGISAAIAVSELHAADIAKYFREHPEIAGALLGESYDKRYTP